MLIESSCCAILYGNFVVYNSFLGHIGNISKKNLGNFSIIEITHEVSQGSYYKNRFTAIPATIKALPSPKVCMPLAETQMATVLSNADPQGKGRVRVRMNWQTNGMQTGWVRVMTPDGGSSDDVKSNRGFVFIPEVGDQVLLGFRHGDPARPYVMGSLFNGTTGGGGGQGNNCKSLTTRSGSSLKLDDSAGSVTLHDKGGVKMNFDGAGNQTLATKASATTTVGQDASVLRMDKDGNIDLSGHTKVRIAINDNTYIQLTDGEIDIISPVIKVIASDVTQIANTNGEDTGVIVNTDVTINNVENVNINSNKDVNVNSNRDVKITGYNDVKIN